MAEVHDSIDSILFRFLDDDIKAPFLEWDAEYHGSRPLSYLISLQQNKIIRELTASIKELSDAYSSQNNSGNG